jgi:hypothetical protein
MRRLWTAGFALALAVLPAAVLAQSSAGGGGSGGGSGGTVSVSNFPNPQAVSGTLSVVQSGAWSMGLTGSLPAFAATPTFNVGTIAGIATETGVQQVRTALGSPFQAGGSIGNTAFGISGTLPAFAATPTVNLGTLNGAATAANQATEIAALTAASQRTAFVTEANGSAAAANATVSGSARDAGTSPSVYTKCSAVVNSTQSGTLQLWANPDGSAWIQIGAVTVTANVPQSLTLPIYGRYCQLRYANGATAGTFSAFTSLSVN